MDNYFCNFICNVGAHSIINIAPSRVWPFVIPTTVLSVFIPVHKTKFVVWCCHLSNALLLYSIRLHNFDEDVTFSWKRDGMSERKYFDLQIVKFTSLNSSAFNKMFIKSYTLPCTFLGQLTAFKKFCGRECTSSVSVWFLPTPYVGEGVWALGQGQFYVSY